MRAAVVASPRMAHHVEWCGAMAEGLRRHGFAVDLRAEPDATGADFAVCWGWRTAAPLRAAGVDVLVLERGHVGDRGSYTSCGWNGLGARARYADVDDGGARWAALWGHLERPWRDQGSYALLLGQCEGDASLSTLGCSYDEWVQRMVDALRAAGYAVVFRPHPLMVNRGAYFRPTAAACSTTTLEEDLAGAAVAVAFNSTAAVESVLAGVPTVTCDEGAMAWPVTSHTVDEPLCRPDRQEWCARIAWAQFSYQEIANGDAWAHLAPTRLAD